MALSRLKRSQGSVLSPPSPAPHSALELPQFPFSIHFLQSPITPPANQHHHHQYHQKPHQEVTFKCIYIYPREATGSNWQTTLEEGAKKEYREGSQGHLENRRESGALTLTKQCHGHRHHVGSAKERMHICGPQ